ncbi:hypothetical protein Taro_041842 [Colocasia esculenta]|uniref:phosphatidate phosphatase n=1 Tax=Colocasia esculenta TaxID=4460 RepID=A0A843WYD0_COLES|nr:hypothetical protein [Colocasia esculenta]
MYAVERLSSYITRGVYTVSGPFHPFGGAVDIIVVQQQDGSFKSSPWNVRFGKFQGVLKTKEKIVKICVNGTDAEFHMYLDHKGEAYFLKDASHDEGETLMLSPPSSGDETDGRMKNARLRKAQSYNFDESCREPVDGHFNVENDKTVARTNPRRPRIFGFVFGRRTVEESSNGVNMERISSLERAEIAADLLEVKWSTNLTTNGQMGTSCLKIPANGDRGENMVNGEQRLAMQSSDSGLAHDDKIATQREEIGGNMESRNEEHLVEPVFNGCPELRTLEEVIEIYSSKGGELTHDNETRLSSPKAVEFDVSFEESVSVNRTIDLCSCNFHELSGNKDCILAYGTSGEDIGDREVSSFSSCEASQSSNMMHDISASTTIEILNSLLEVDRDKVATEHLKETTQQQCEKHHKLEPRPSNVRENSDVYCDKSLELNNHKDPVPSDRAIAEPCERPDVGYLSTEALSSLDLSLPSSESIETKTVNVIQGDVLEEETAREKVMVTNMLEISQNQYVMDRSCAEPNCNTLGFNVDQQLSSSEEVRTCSSYVPPETFDIGDKIQEPHNPIESVQFDRNDFPVEDIITSKLDSGLHMSEVANAAFFLPDSLEEDQFLFNEIHSFASNEHPARSALAGEIDAEDYPFTVPDGLQEHESADMSLDVHDADISALSKFQTSPISIPKLKSCPKEKRQCLGSLPDIRSHIHDLERPNIHPTSFSLHIKSNMSMWDIPEKDISSFPNIESRSESHLLEPQTKNGNSSVIGVTQRRKEENGNPIRPTVEMSLCRHLLSEGMGAEAASKAFDAEKVDLEKFAKFGSSLVKDDKLVIRIDGHYFPWNAAAPIILGILSFGQKGIFDAEGMISVDQIDKIPERDQSRAIVPSEGAWRLWPFNFKKSRRTNPHLAPNADGSIEQGATTVSGDCKMRSENNAEKSRAMKNKVRSVIPTSEQLASLKLKEGQNLVTFSFSTAMLGRQQVDARIYLWKWNTRIVVSDVDGTITKHAHVIYIYDIYIYAFNGVLYLHWACIQQVMYMDVDDRVFVPPSDVYMGNMPLRMSSVTPEDLEQEPRRMSFYDTGGLEYVPRRMSFCDTGGLKHMPRRISDVLGQFMPLVGKDWSQTGVAHLFSAIKENGYQLLFLSARAISQAYLTRQFLFNIKQDGKVLPDGPVVISPDGLFPSLYREDGRDCDKIDKRSWNCSNSACDKSHLKVGTQAPSGRRESKARETSVRGLSQSGRR